MVLPFVAVDNRAVFSIVAIRLPFVTVDHRAKSSVGDNSAAVWTLSREFDPALWFSSAAGGVCLMLVCGRNWYTCGSLKPH